VPTVAVQHVVERCQRQGLAQLFLQQRLERWYDHHPALGRITEHAWRSLSTLRAWSRCLRAASMYSCPLKGLAMRTPKFGSSYASCFYMKLELVKVAPCGSTRGSASPLLAAKSPWQQMPRLISTRPTSSPKALSNSTSWWPSLKAWLWKKLSPPDALGPDAYNQKLSLARALALTSYLVAQGVDERLISAQGRGKTQPIADNTTCDGRAKNRRVELKIVATQTK
jgi:OmpA family